MIQSCKDQVGLDLVGQMSGQVTSGQIRSGHVKVRSGLIKIRSC